jgi:hypothetical protein
MKTTTKKSGYETHEPLPHWFYLDRTADGHCHNGHSGGLFLPGAGYSQVQGQNKSMPEQFHTIAVMLGRMGTGHYFCGPVERRDERGIEFCMLKFTAVPEPVSLWPEMFGLVG